MVINPLWKKYPIPASRRSMLSDFFKTGFKLSFITVFDSWWSQSDADVKTEPETVQIYFYESTPIISTYFISVPVLKTFACNFLEIQLKKSDFPKNVWN